MKFSVCGTLKKINSGFLILHLLLVGLLVPFVSAESKHRGFNWKNRWKVSSCLYHDVSEYSSYEDTDDVHAELRWDNRFESNDKKYLAVVNLVAKYDYFFGKDTEKDLDIFLDEAYLQRKSSDYLFSIGKQIVTWGKLDDVIVIDRISPQDFSRFVLVDKQERKKAELMLRYVFYRNDFQFEGVFIPFFYPSYLKFRGSDWAVFGHLVETVREGNYPLGVKNAVEGVRIVTKDSYAQRSLRNSEVAFRVRSRMKEVDWDLCYMYIRSRIPVLRERTAKGNIIKKFLYLPGPDTLTEVSSTSFSNNDLILEREHPRVHIVGGDFETVVGNYGVRGEGGFFSGLPYLRSDFSYVRKDTVILGVGVDHTTSFNLYWNVQFIETYILNYEPLFSQEEYSHAVTANLKREFMDGRWEFSFDLAYNISYGDRMFSPSLTYKFPNGLNATLSAFVFQGNLTTLFGRYAKDDVVCLELKQIF